MPWHRPHHFYTVYTRILDPNLWYSRFSFNYQVMCNPEKKSDSFKLPDLNILRFLKYFLFNYFVSQRTNSSCLAREIHIHKEESSMRKKGLITFPSIVVLGFKIEASYLCWFKIWHQVCTILVENQTQSWPTIPLWEAAGPKTTIAGHVTGPFFLPVCSLSILYLTVILARQLSKQAIPNSGCI